MTVKSESDHSPMVEMMDVTCPTLVPLTWRIGDVGLLGRLCSDSLEALHTLNM
jgi:hypothetical protein